ncbi:hypothetical protein ACFSJM_08445 [Lactococcus formosensis subsp. bovis]|uniref:hypothetical protein n=1 Tax=Lactococcus formosensis TaxID=1281486 RepID=UPI001BCB89C1|nr:hypothetical protein [Lactococcus formosensis]
MDPEYMKQLFLEQEEKETKLILDFLKLTKPSFYQYLETLQEKASKYDELMAEEQDEEV